MLSEVFKHNQDKMKEIHSYFSNNGVDKVNELRDKLRLDVDLAREENIELLHKQSEKLMEDIDSFTNKCIEKLGKRLQK